MKIERRSGRNAWGEWEKHVAIDDSGIESSVELAEMGRDEFQLFVNGSLRWAKYNAQGKRISRGSDWITTPTDEELRALDSIAKELIAYRYTQQTRYIRFGRLPKDGRIQESRYRRERTRYIVLRSDV